MKTTHFIGIVAIGTIVSISLISESWHKLSPQHSSCCDGGIHGPCPLCPWCPWAHGVLNPVWSNLSLVWALLFFVCLEKYWNRPLFHILRSIVKRCRWNGLSQYLESFDTVKKRLVCPWPWLPCPSGKPQVMAASARTICKYMFQQCWIWEILKDKQNILFCFYFWRCFKH